VERDAVKPAEYRRRMRQRSQGERGKAAVMPSAVARLLAGAENVTYTRGRDPETGAYVHTWTPK
jgi:hypothetical protein